MARSRSKGMILVLFATIVWATSGILIINLLDSGQFTAISLAFWRDLATFVCLLVGIIVLRPSLLHINSRDLIWLGAMGVISIGIFHVIWNLNVYWNGAALATVIQSNSPIFVALAAWLFWRETIDLRKIGAIFLAITGTLLITRIGALSDARFTLIGVGIGLLSAITYGSFSLFGKKLSGDYSSWTILVYSFGFGALVLLPFQFREPIPWPLEGLDFGRLAALVLLATVLGFGLYTASLGHLPASVASITATAEVPIAAIYAYFTLGERLTVGQVMGALLIIVGVVLISVPRATKIRLVNPPNP